MGKLIHLFDVQLLGERNDPGIKPRFTAIGGPAEALIVREAGGRAREDRHKPGRFWISGPLIGRIHDTVPNPWNVQFGPDVIGEIIAEIAPANISRLGLEPMTVNIIFILVVKVTWRPSWLEHVAAIKAKHAKGESA